MKGTSMLQTLAMLLTPPRMTAAVRRQMMRPVIHVGTPHDVNANVEMALACTVFPMPKDAMVVNMANNVAIHFQPSPFSRAYIGPPNIPPFGVLSRYLIARRPSPYFVAMPKTPVNQHHNTAPGPQI